MTSLDAAPSRSQADHTLTAPSISLPKGGGAIRGIGEKFAANPVTGTGSMTVPIATSPGRAGFGPQLGLSYDSGAGNGPFGFGWTLSLPAITCKTDKGLPRYNDADVYVLSGAEDLVPMLGPDGDRLADPDSAPGYTIHRYRPRIEGLFARIERWTRQDGDIHWRSISGDNILSIYGKDEHSRIAAPADPDTPDEAARVFSWLICETRDDKGNAVLYEYKPEDGAGVDLGHAHERNRGERDDPRRATNRYLKHIRYGNRTPLLAENGKRPRDLTPEQIENADWMFEVVLDYGEHDADAPTPGDSGEWPPRADSFSSYRAGFEVRTMRLCRRVLMFHHFAGEPNVGIDCLVRSTEFTYSHDQDPESARNPVYTFLLAVTQSGYSRDNGGYLKRSLPAVEFGYTKPVVQDTVHDVDAESLANLPIGLDGTTYQWTDLHGEGIPGILTEQAGAWYYKRNLSPRNLAPNEDQQVEFAPLECVASKPNLALAGGQAQFMDLAGDGQPDLVVLDGPMPGLYEHDGAEGWQPFRPFSARLNRDMRDPNLRLVDLDGDGHADVLITEDDALVWHASLAEAGFDQARRMSQALDEEKGPRLVFADGTQSVYLADMSGDGLTDLVRIRSDGVCYWPNLGYCRFGAKISMDHAPHFDCPDEFDHKRIRVADIDGTGTTDIIYLNDDDVRLYFNQSGNSWSEPRVLTACPRVNDLVAITPVDLLGNGTACLVWSSPLPGDAHRPMRYVNLIGEHKPHLLVRTANNLGAETRVHYAPSTKFYLQDKRDGRPWVTRLPFPVHVVEYVETYDHISRNRFVTRYAYHHGFFDGEEREFRGFGMVEQWDTEQIGALASFDEAGSWAQEASNFDPASHVPPVHTKTWFHTGVYWDGDHISRQFEQEYYREPGLTDPDFQALLLPDTTLPNEELTLEEEREACRALKGAMLRQEVYALDGSDRQPHPYTVTEQDFTIRRLQPRVGNRHAVFFTHPREAITYHYERRLVSVLDGRILAYDDEATSDPRVQRLPDPRTQHALTLEVDRYGNVLKEAAIGYGRRFNSPEPGLTPVDREKQRLIHITCTENTFTNAIVDGIDAYRTPLPAETITFELRKPEQERSGDGLTVRYGFDDMLKYVKQTGDEKHDIAYEDIGFAGARQAAEIVSEERDRYFRRPIEHTCTLYRRNDLTALLPLGELEALALLGESYQLAFTPGLLEQVFQRNGQPLLPNAAEVLGGQGADQGGYLASQTLKADGSFPATDPDDHWWIPGGRVFFSPDKDHGAGEELDYAREHFFLPHRYRDPFGHTTFVSYDSDANPQKNHNLLTVKTEDAVGNTITAINDYRVLQPEAMTDPNGNRSEVRFDALGMIVGTAVMGKADGPIEGDSFADFKADLTPGEIEGYFDANDPRPLALSHLGTATTRILYDLDRVPACAATIARETHVSDLGPDENTRLQLSFSYSDGFGREIQQKIQAEPGAVPLRDANGRILVGADGQPQMSDGAANPRWVGSGWTIFNNKGKPVRQFEPFFSDTHKLDDDVRIGVSPWLFYDPVERVVATLHPNHTWEKVVFDPWQQGTWDVNDTVTIDPQTDAHVKGYFVHSDGTPRLPEVDYLPTWHALRTDPAHAAAFAARYPNAADRANETIDANKAAGHADTPATAHFDTLGRPFLTIAHNKVVCPGHRLDGDEDRFHTRVELDIEGNERAVRDAVTQAWNEQGDEVEDPLGRIVMRYDYDLLGNRIHQLSMEAGVRWMLKDVTGKPIRVWDSRGHDFASAYDALRRPIEQRLRGTGPEADPRTLGPDFLLFETIEYGESQPDAEALNLRTRVYRHSDSAGIVTNAAPDPNSNETQAYDFKGNLLRGSRQLVSDYQGIPDWNLAPTLDDEILTAATRYDALNRPRQSTAPHSSLARAKRNIMQPVFNDANLLERVDVWLGRAAEPDGVLNPAEDALSEAVGVANIDYDAKGQRLHIDYKNGASTFYRYDPQTFRLVHLLTRRQPADFPDDCPQPPSAGWPDCQVQNLRYTYDPAGNITHIRDDAQQTIYFKNQRVEPNNDYTYDALYRLIRATGREHLGQTAGVPNAPSPHTYKDAGRVGVPSTDGVGLFAPNDGRAMGTYVEQYVYDAVGNFIEMQHRGSHPAHPGWTRSYAYNEKSLIEEGVDGTLLKISNRLSSTSVGNGPAEEYSHDAHGNMIRMPHLGGTEPGPNLHWNYKDQMRQTGHGGGGTAYYVYDAAGERVRKVWEKSAGRIEERIYLGGFEIFRRHGGAIGADTVTLERETLHVIDDKQRIALVETRTLDTVGDDPAPMRLIRYQFGNHLGSASLELDHEAQILSYEEYTPYGSTSYQAVRSDTETPKRYRYTGKERDEESGLCYHGARYYAAQLGNWISTDPTGIEHGFNLYLFVSRNPITRSDLDGRWDRDMHFLGVYWAGRMQGANHTQAVIAAIGSQHLDDTPRDLNPFNNKNKARDAPSAKASPKEGDRQYGNNAHALNLTKEESGRIARVGIAERNVLLFGIGLHTVGDYLPHGNLSGKYTWGHQNGLNEDFSDSDQMKADADFTTKNPRKALATVERFREMWSEYLGRKESYSRFKLGEKNLDSVSAFIFTKNDDETQKLRIVTDWLKSEGAAQAEIDDVVKYYQNRNLREQAIAAMQGTTKGSDAIATAKGVSLALKNNSALFNSGVNVDLNEELRDIPDIATPEFEQRRGANRAILRGQRWTSGAGL